LSSLPARKGEKERERDIAEEIEGNKIMERTKNERKESKLEQKSREDARK
jgi:hypothetical protein